MSRLTWDAVGARVFEAGLDRGVLYLEDSTGVSWNGLTSISEEFSDDTSEPVYLDGVKRLDSPSIGDFSATLTAFTYPDEFLDYEGVASLGGGLSVDNQGSKLFGLSYRTKVGNDVDGIDHGYKLHILYNLTAIPEASNYGTLSDSTDPLEFSWSLTGVPMAAPNFRPTAHVIFDSRYLNAVVLSSLEDILYGRGEVAVPDLLLDGGPTPDDPDADLYDGGDPDPSDDPSEKILDAEADVIDTSEPRLPTITELMDIIFFFAPYFVVANTVTGLAQLAPGIGDLVETTVDGVYASMPGSRLLSTSLPGIYILGS